jgi:hypothetical protein
VGLLTALGFAVVIGLLMSAVAQSQVVRDPRERGTSLDLRSVTVEHSGQKIVTKLRLYEPVKVTRLPGGSKIWVSLHPGGDDYYLMEMSFQGSEGAAVLVPCNADACDYDHTTQIAGKVTGKRSFKMVLELEALLSLGDRLEWQAGSLQGTHRIDVAPDEGFKVHHL